MLLVTTALSAVRLPETPSVFLGEWCRQTPTDEAVTANCLPYHWDIPLKRETDFRYLQALYERLLPVLATWLDAYHGTTWGRGYWEIIVAPWLGLYITSCFDRWEAIRAACEKEHIWETVRLTPPRPVECTDGFFDQATRMGSNDEYNYQLYMDIIETTCQDRFTLIDRPARPTRGIVGASAMAASLKTAGRTADETDRKRSTWSHRLWCECRRSRAVAFIGAHFRVASVRKLRFLLKQWPLSCNTFSEGAVGPRWLSRQPERVRQVKPFGDSQVAGEDAFAQFVLSRLWKEIPWPYVEAYAELRERVRTDVPFPKVVVTAHMHRSTELFKIWLAEGAREGMKVVLCPHGGSFPPADYGFGWEERIADVYVPSYKSHHPKHVQLPPPKYIGVRPTRRPVLGDHIIVLPYTVGRYATRASSQPKSKQALDGARQCIQLCHALPEPIRQKVRIKLRRSPPGFGHDLRALFTRELGHNAVWPDMDLDDAFKYARLVVCTYPESTFAESMLSGVPTVLFIDPSIHGIHAVAAEDIALLQRAQIMFLNPVDLASHIRRVWPALETWWDDRDVRAARTSFFKSTMLDDRRPLRKWRDFLRTVVMDGAKQVGQQQHDGRQEWPSRSQA